MVKKRLSILGVLLAVFALWPVGCSKPSVPAAGPPSVEVAEVIQKDVPITREWVATLDGFVNAQIRAQVSGILLRQAYANGAYVKKGAPLFEIDPRPFQAALDQANGNLAQAKANLLRADAQLGKTELDVARYTPLAKESAISQQELDDAVQADLAAKAQVEQAKAAIESAKAAAESAKLNLGFCNIVAPIDGVTAIATAQVGDFVGPQSGILTTVSTVDPILATITPSEQDYLRVMRAAVEQGRSEDTVLRGFEWQLKLAEGSTFPSKGRFYAINRQVDIRTGAIVVQLEFPNPGNVLRPGGFGNASTVVRIQQGALLIPQRAVSEVQGGYMVATVDHANKATLHAVKLGQKFGTWWIVDEGLKPGDRVVAEGVQAVKDGAQVTPTPFKENPPAAEKPAKTSGGE
ncbi:MAG TPA: efflux RND transporter periplasmic adaptor subunit [Candidatus Binatia bacterium]|nr:efflux RND transporter periplasmic adaptor subunit [Candidatus Binatia bacterium]